MTDPVQVRLLGIPEVKWHQETVKFPYKKTEGIFYYLCIKKQTSRDELIHVFWGDFEEKTGRKNLRQVLYQLKKILGEDILSVTGQSRLALNPEREMELDWELGDEEFLRRQEDFLSYFYIRGCREFEQWVEECRQQQKARCLGILQRKFQDPEAAYDVKTLHALVRIWRRWEPYEEIVVKTAMERYARIGQYNLAIRLFYEYRDQLKNDLDEEPGDEAAALFDRIFRMKESVTNQKARNDDFFYGRFEEIYRINEQIQAFLRGQPCHSLVIRGDIGVGKTALLHTVGQLSRRGRGLALTASCYQVEQEFYLKVWMDIFRQLETLLAEHVISLSETSTRMLAQILGGILPGAEEESLKTLPSSGYLWLEYGVMQLFEELTAERKVILYVDDLQWMDDISCQLLQRLMLKMGGTRILLVAASHFHGSETMENVLHLLWRHRLVQFMELAPFTEAETDAIVRTVLTEREQLVDAGELYRRTEGNALLLMDILNLIQKEGWTPGMIPGKTGELIQIRLRGLAPERRQILEALSMYIDYAELEELEILVRRDLLDICEELEWLQRARWIVESVEGGRIVYAFRHQVYRDCIYQSQSLGKRRLWHRQVAEFYETHKGGSRFLEMLPFLVYQYEMSGDQKTANRYRVQYYGEVLALGQQSVQLLYRRIEAEMDRGGAEMQENLLALVREVIREEKGESEAAREDLALAERLGTMMKSPETLRFLEDIRGENED